VVRSKHKDKAMGRIVGFKKERTGVVLDIEFKGKEKSRKCRRNFVYLP
jgi:hypothetical protein